MMPMSWDTFPQEISEFSEALRKASETERTADTLTGLYGAFEHSWRRNKSVHSGSGIPIPPPRDKALFPKACEISDADLTFMFVLGEAIEDEPLPARCDFQVRVRGTAQYKDSVYVELEDHWRVDTHIKSKNGSESREPHPYIHFQRGGHAQDRFAEHQLFVPGDGLSTHESGPWQSLLQSPGPRVPFLPFCPILAIDYAVGQHDGSVLRKLRSLPEYSAVVRRAQRRLWDPFFARLSASATLRKQWFGGLLIEGD